MTIEASIPAGIVGPPGRLGDPSKTLRTEPRADPRMVAALAEVGLDGHPEPIPVSLSSSLSEQLEYCNAAEEGFEGLFAALVDGVPPVRGVTSEKITITGSEGNAINLFVHRPRVSTGELPCIYHVHGGGMALLEAAGPGYARWRDELAATGLVVVGVEFRNAAGRLGPHPYPAGLNDCASGLRWAAAHLGALGTSHIVVSGESGGGNLSLALTHKAKREGWLSEISGVYALCPYISNEWAEPPARLASLLENDGYFIGRDSFPVLAHVYDPGFMHNDEPMCWPTRATSADLESLPPHVVSVNELDPFRDEGIEYYRKLRDAGVSAVGRVVLGTCHAGDVFFRMAMPDVYASTVRDISGFAHSLQ
jgi:acetyl esterase/lipase